MLPGDPRRNRRFLAVIGPTLTAISSAFPLYWIRASDGTFRGSLQADEHGILLLILLATLLLAWKRSPWSWLAWFSAVYLLTANALEISSRLPAQGEMNFPVWIALTSGMLLSLTSLPRTDEIFAEDRQRGNLR